MLERAATENSRGSKQPTGYESGDLDRYNSLRSFFEIVGLSSLATRNDNLVNTRHANAILGWQDHLPAGYLQQENSMSYLWKRRMPAPDTNLESSPILLMTCWYGSQHRKDIV